MIAPGGQNNWTLTSKPCDSCKASVASLYCHTHSYFLCLSCDSTVHKAVLRHARVWLCEVCEQAPAIVTCKADAASLCATCDRDIHSANPLAKRHERVAVVPFYDSPVMPKAEEEEDSGAGRYLSDSEEAASWLLPNPNHKDEVKPSDYLFSEDVDPYLDLDLMMGDQKQAHHHHHQYVPSAVATTIADGVVPVVPGKFTNENVSSMCVAPAVVEGLPCYDDMDYAGSKPFLIYNFNSQSITQSVSSSSLEVGVVPDHNTLGDVSKTASLPQGSVGHDIIVPLSRIDREARVMRYREKRKNRKFEKTIRYASRKAYAETRPRIKGRFAKRTDTMDVDALFNSSSILVADAEYDVVPSF